MLRTRLWMGTVLILLTVGVLLLDNQFAPWYPFLFGLMLVLSLLGMRELLALLGPERRPWPALCYGGAATLLLCNWLPHLCPFAARISGDPLRWLLGAYVAVVLAGFLFAMAEFNPESRSPHDTLAKLSLALFAVAYLGLLPSFIAQLRWPETIRSENHVTVALALAIFIPKCCDSGAYFTGRLLGRTKMTPILSPKKTWEGLAGGLATGTIAAVAINRLGPALPGGDLAAVGFGLTVSVAGVLGDLAESLVKRECRQKDASQVMPGFGGVLDVIDAIIFAAPVAYLWLA